MAINVDLTNTWVNQKPSTSVLISRLQHITNKSEKPLFPIEIWLTYTAASILLALSPGPDNLLAIGRGLSQGPLAAIVSGVSCGCGALFHVATATFGLTLLIQTSSLAFWVVKIIGAAYLIWLGIKVLRSGDLINFTPSKKQSFRKIFAIGFFSAALNPKPGLFILAFIPQFVDPTRGSITTQMLVYGIWFCLLAAMIFSLMGIFATKLSAWLQKRPRIVSGLNIGAGLTFLISGLSIIALKQK